MVEPVSFKGNFLTDMFKKKPYREKIKKSVVFLNGHEFSRPVNLVKEYKNPNAKQIIKQMRKLPFPTDEFRRLDKELGPYEVIDLDFEKQTKKLYRQLDRDIMLMNISEKAGKFFNSIKKAIIR